MEFGTRTRDGEPSPIRSCEPVARYPFRVARNIARKQICERTYEYTEIYPYISVTQGEVLVDDFSSIDHAIKDA